MNSELELIKLAFEGWASSREVDSPAQFESAALQPPNSFTHS